jgi:hypothetical protein
VTIEDLQACDPEGAGIETNAHAAVTRKLEKLNLTHVRALFATKKLAFSTSLIMLVWALIGKFDQPPEPQCSISSSALTPHRPWVPSIQRLPAVYPSDARGRIPRWLHVHYLPQLAHNCRPRRPRCPRGRSASRDSSLWSEGRSGTIHHPHRRVPLRLDDGINLQRPAGLELCI